LDHRLYIPLSHRGKVWQSAFVYPTDEEDALVVSGFLKIQPMIRMYSYGFLFFIKVPRGDIFSGGIGNSYKYAVLTYYVPVITLIPVASNISMAGHMIGILTYESLNNYMIFRVQGVTPASVLAFTAAANKYAEVPLNYKPLQYSGAEKIIAMPAYVTILRTLNSNVIPAISQFAEEVGYFQKPTASTSYPTFLSKSSFILLSALAGSVSPDETPYQTSIYYYFSDRPRDIDDLHPYELTKRILPIGSQSGDPATWPYVDGINTDKILNDIYTLYFAITKPLNDGRDMLKMIFWGAVDEGTLRKTKEMLDEVLASGPAQSKKSVKKVDPFIAASKNFNILRDHGALAFQFNPYLLFSSMITPTFGNVIKMYTNSKDTFYLPLYPSDIKVRAISQNVPEEFRDVYRTT